MADFHPNQEAPCCAKPAISNLSSRSFQTLRFYCANCGTNWNGRAEGHAFGPSMSRYTRAEWEKWVNNVYGDAIAAAGVKGGSDAS
jgi:alpha-glucuronidase